MIYANKNQLIIPYEERVIGHFGDNKVHTRQFEITNEAVNGVEFVLYILFSDGKINYVTLEKSADRENVFVWNILAEQIYKSGIAYVQIRAESDKNEIWHSPKATVEFLDSIDEKEITEDYSPAIFRKIDERIDELYDIIENLDLDDKYVSHDELQQLVISIVSDLNYITYEAAQQLVTDVLNELNLYITRDEAVQLVESSINELMLPLDLRLEGI